MVDCCFGYSPRVSRSIPDITLATTTLRYANTNEVSSVSNSSIAASRIINCNRSPSAIVFLFLDLHACVLDDGETKFQRFQSVLQSYVAKNPRAWDQLLYCRVDEMNAHHELVRCKLGFRHRSSWQDAGRIMVQRGDLIKFVHRTASELGIDYVEPPHRRLLYGAGTLRNGGVRDYKSNLLNPDNIRSCDAPADVVGSDLLGLRRRSVVGAGGEGVTAVGPGGRVGAPVSNTDRT